MLPQFFCLHAFLSSLSLSLSRYASPVSFLWSHLLFTRTLGLPSTASSLTVPSTELATKCRERSWTMHDMFLCFCGLAEQFQQMSCTQMSNYRNRGPYRDGGRHSDICTLDTSQAVTPSVRCACSQLCTYHRQPVLISVWISRHINRSTLLWSTLLCRSRRTACCTSVEIFC